VTEQVSEKGKPFTDTELLKSCFIRTVEELCSEKIKEFKYVSLSMHTGEPGSSISIASDYRLGSRDLIPDRGRGFFL
jgi:hypothetical protein